MRIKSPRLLLLFFALTSQVALAISPDEITNPYYSGCLREKLPKSSFTKLRVCNRHDTVDSPYCRPPDFDSYMEIRINAGNWDSPIITAWLVQIILSEILGVPTSVEAGSYVESRDFYDPQSRIDYDTSSYVDFLAEPTKYDNGDCLEAPHSSPDDYTPCAHFNPEHWHVEHANVTRQLQGKGIDPPQNIGSLGHETWFITKFSVEKDPTLVSYMGLQGEANRPKLAEAFKRPTTWSDYCTLLSSNNCTSPDEYAQRPPQSEEEGSQYFSSGQFTGYFRATEHNNCTANPKTCTGHIANYPCDWPSYMESQLYHLGIALESNGPVGKTGGYPYSRAVELWHAANATKSNLMMQFWTPEPLYKQYLGTDAEMIQVILPPQTQECVDARPQNECSEVLAERVGPPEAACSQAPKPLQKMTSSVLRQAQISPDIPDAVKSPAYEMLKGFQLHEVQLNELFGLWSSGASPREGVCQWAADHLEFLLVNVPSTYPRVPQKENESIFAYVVTAVAALATLMVLVTSVAVRQREGQDSIRYAQVEFLWLLLIGSLLITLGSLLSSLPANNGTCIASIWLINIGYTLELVPLIVKVAAINKMMSGARRMRRVKLPRRQLYGAVAVISFFCLLFLTLWTALDPPQKASEYTLTEETTDKDDYIVALSHYCEDGKSNGWKFAAVGWNGVLLLCASVLAFQSRDIIQTFNESQTLAILIYSHFVFVVLRCATYFLENQLDGTMLNHIRSLLYSVDTLATIVIYFVPKLLAKANVRPSVSTHISGLNSEGVKAPGLSGLTNSNPHSDPMGKSGSITASGLTENRHTKEPEHALSDEDLKKEEREIPAF